MPQWEAIGRDASYGGVFEASAGFEGMWLLPSAGGAQSSVLEVVSVIQNISKQLSRPRISLGASAAHSSTIGFWDAAVIQEMVLSCKTVYLYGYKRNAKSWCLSVIAMMIKHGQSADTNTIYTRL